MRTGTLMPPNVDDVPVNIGKAQMGLMGALHSAPGDNR
jgi:hypothetical protein